MNDRSPVIRTPDQRVRVFVSSTLQELAPERAAATEAIRGLKLTPVLFELGARPHPPRELYRSYLEQSHVFVGIYGEQYGWIAPGMEISGLEDEYLLSGDRPKLIYVKEAAARDERLEALLRRIEGDERACYKKFATPQELGAMLADDLAVLLSERFETAEAPRAAGATGWLRSTAGRRLAVGAAVAGIALVAALALLRRPEPATAPGAASDPSAGPPYTEPEAASIAVLPFVDMSPAGDQEYFSDGLSEELLNVLAHVPQLRVISRTSSFQFKGKSEDVRTIGRRLNVANVLEGSVRKSGKKLRITAQLVDTATGSHRWSETYDRELDDVFRVQDEIAGEVVRNLEVLLVGGSLPARPAPRSTEAYTLVLQGRFYSDRRTREDSDKAVDRLRRAVELDPEYAVAWAELARAYVGQAGGGFAPRDESIARAREAAEKALALDPNLASAHAMLGYLQAGYDLDWRGADLRYRRALELDSGSSGILANAGMIARGLGRLDESVDRLRRAIARDPLQALLHANLAISLLYAGKLDEAEAACRLAIDLRPKAVSQKYLLGRILLAKGELEAAREAVESEPDEGWRWMGQAIVYHALGRTADADAAVRSLITTFPEDMPFQIAEALAFRGETDAAFDWLERARALRDPGLVEMKGDPLLRALEGDPRYPRLLRELGLPEA